LIKSLRNRAAGVNVLKNLRKALKNLGEKLGELLDRTVEALFGRRQPTPELIPIPVRNGNRRIPSRY
jgi:hypothetical protein